MPIWMTGWLPPPPLSAYRDLMACRLVALDKRPRVRPIGIGEMLHRSIVKIIIRTAGDQVKIAYGSLQLCAGIEAGIEGETHAVAQMRR